MTTLELLYFYPLVTFVKSSQQLLLEKCWPARVAMSEDKKEIKLKTVTMDMQLGVRSIFQNHPIEGSDFYLTFILKILMVKVVNWHMCSSQKR
jgi:hypothetical protein